MSYQKNFDQWSKNKQLIQELDTPKIYPKIRHIWYAKIGINIGFEADGKDEFLRPVLVLAKIVTLYGVAPLTSKFKEDKFHYELTSVSFKQIDHSLVMLSQAKIIDKKRFQERINIISVEEYNIIQKKMKKLYFSSL